MPAPLLHVVDLGRLAYRPALERQRRVHAAVLEGQAPETLLLVEHEPVVTVSHRKSAAGNLLAGPEALKKLGIDVAETDRGGDVTYHGPGQLVAYPILRMASYGLNVTRYMRLLEAAVIDCAARFGVHARRDDGYTGVWADTQRGPAKLCAMGVRVRRNVTMHGLALNVDPDLSHFQTIVPCGLPDRAVTSLREILGPRCPSMDQAKDALASAIQAQLDPLRRQEQPSA